MKIKKRSDFKSLLPGFNQVLFFNNGDRVYDFSRLGHHGNALAVFCFCQFHRAFNILSLNVFTGNDVLKMHLGKYMGMGFLVGFYIDFAFEAAEFNFFLA